MSPPTSQRISARLIGAAAVIVLGALLAGTYVQTCLSSRQLSDDFISLATWFALMRPFQSGPNATANTDSTEIPFLVTLAPCLVVSLLTWIGGALWISKRRQISLAEALILWGWYGWFWWCLVDAWEWLWLIATLTKVTSVIPLLLATPQFWLAGCMAGWMTTAFTLGHKASVATGAQVKLFHIRWLWCVCGIYFVVFTTMNWRLYWNLLVPHGDSAMYEEHLWNLTHGKGFRSYLDQGLFLGEHLQIVHLFLLPLYLIWPSHLMLEACSSASLALGAFPVFWMVRRQTGSDWTAFAAAVAYLLYFPMQFLDIEIDLKTFRPESFGIPLLLLTLDQLDRRSLAGTLVGIIFCLTVKEDYAIVFGPLGLWIALCETPQRLAGCGALQSSGKAPESSVVPAGASFGAPQPPSQNQVLQPLLSHTARLDHRRTRLIFGFGLCLLSVFYLWLATRVVIPWFRSGVEVHYASYFARFGKSPEEILRTMFARPSLLFDSLLTVETALYAIAMLAPLAFFPLLAPLRLAVGLPLFAILCLNELEGSRTPQHQFHAPLVAIIFWSLAAALPRATTLIASIQKQFATGASPLSGRIVGCLIWTSSLTTGLFFSLSPLGIPFWDPGSSWNWRLLYAPSHRAAMFARIERTIPLTARVASTDFVHPRFTHHERSYDYSGYSRKVSGEGRRIPKDTDYLVIDTQHRYSTIKKPEDVPEWRDDPDDWELLPDNTEGYFIVLKRKPGQDSSTKDPEGIK